MRVFLAGLGISILAAGMSLQPANAANGASPTGDYTDASGLTVVMASHDQVVPEALRDAYAAYDALSEAYPDDFGYASPNISNGRLSVAVVTAKGEAALDALANGRRPTAPSTLPGESAEAVDKRIGALEQAAGEARGFHVVVTHASRSRADVERETDALIEWSKDPRFGDADIWQTSVERSTGRVIVTAAKLTPALAQAIVLAYGTDKVAVQVAPNPRFEPNVGRLADNSPFWGGARINAPAGTCTDAFSGASARLPRWLLRDTAHRVVGQSARRLPQWAA